MMKKSCGTFEVGPHDPHRVVERDLVPRGEHQRHPGGAVLLEVVALDVVEVPEAPNRAQRRIPKHQISSK